MTSFDGKALFLDRSDINTDEIIPAQYLTEDSKAALAPYILEDMKIDGFDPIRDTADVNVIVTRENFGCGSSREHAVWVLEVNDIRLVIGASFARIFRQNMFNCGMMAITLEPDTIDTLFSQFAGRPTRVTTDLAEGQLTFTANGDTETVAFRIGAFDLALVEAGGWVNFADQKYKKPSKKSLFARTRR